MVNDIAVTQGSGTTIATDEIGGVHHQKVKVEFGVDDSATQVSTSNPLPVVQTGTPALATGATTEATLSTRLSESDFDSKTGSLTETAPASDTASSGLNGRLQRIAQRITSLIALLPTALGAGGGLKVDGSGTALPVSGSVTANIGTSGSLALDATLTGGTAKSVVRGGAKGSTSAADVTSTAQSADRQALDVQIRTSAGVAVDTFGGGTQYATGSAQATPTGTVSLGWDGTNVKALPLDGSGFLKVNVAAGGASGGTSSSFGSAIPATGTAAGFSDGTNMQAPRVFDGDSGAGTQYVAGAILRKSASGGTVEAGTSSDPLRTDPTGTTTQPVSAASLPLPSGASTETTLGTRLSESDFDTKVGSLTETAPASDTASSGLNGRLQRIAQRLTSIIALLPTALGAGGGLKVDGSGTALPVSGTVAVTGVATETTLGTRLSESDFDTKTGSLTETAPASDTASSGLNGRLQRIAQRVTSLIALLPTSLGQKAMSASLAVTLASDQSAISVLSGQPTDTTGTFTNATQTNSVTASTLAGYETVTVSINGTYGTATAVFEVSDDGGTTWYTTQGARSDSATIETGYTSLTNTSRMWIIPINGADTFRVRSTAVASGTVNVRISPTAMSSSDSAVVSLPANQSVNVSQINGVTPSMGSGTNGTGVQRVTMATDQAAISTAGLFSVKIDQTTPGTTNAVQDASTSATGSAVPSKATYASGIAKTANPTAASDGNLTGVLLDKLGKQVTVGSIRDLKVQQNTTITSSTTETTVLTAVASTFLDVYGVLVVNTSASACEVTFKDSTAGTTRFPVYVPAGETRGFMLPEGGGHNQATVNNNWTATCGTSVASIKITMFAVKNI